MHEFSLISNLLGKIEAIGREQNAVRIASVSVRLGALTAISPEHFRHHFEQAALGTLAETAHLKIETSTDELAPDAQVILLQNVEVEIPDVEGGE